MKTLGDHTVVYKRILVPVDGSPTSMRRGVNRMIMGSDAELVVRNAATPVLLVKK